MEAARIRVEIVRESDPVDRTVHYEAAIDRANFFYGLTNKANSANVKSCTFD